jgi:hypothetical protein
MTLQKWAQGDKPVGFPLDRFSCYMAIFAVQSKYCDSCATRCCCSLNPPRYAPRPEIASPVRLLCRRWQLPLQERIEQFFLWLRDSASYSPLPYLSRKLRVDAFQLSTLTKKVLDTRGKGDHHFLIGGHHVVPFPTTFQSTDQPDSVYCD